ncbi:MAG: ASPIC/UnbV domain-containing protein [Caldilineaceae bacterium]|nr:ASPIC/UnbV domain-containing protein [Caldilineaceae bacterium]
MHAKRLGAGFAVTFLDFDNHGWLNLHLATTKFVQETAAADHEGMHDPYADILFHNEDNGRFVDVVGTRWNEGLQLYRNTGPWGSDNRSLTIRLEGDGRHVNRDAAGARVYLTRDDGQVLMREVRLGSSLGAGNDAAVHFGLGRSRITDLEIVWPDGTRQVVEPPESQFLIVAYDTQ